MINGLFFDQRMWNMDIIPSIGWQPKKYGINIDLCTNESSIVNDGINEKYKFIIVSEVWTRPMRDIMEYLRARNIKIFFLPRELVTFSRDALFNYDIHLYKGEKFFCPDIVFAPNSTYYELWKDKAKCYLTGHPKFDYCIQPMPDKKIILEKYGLDKDRMTIFFPSYPPMYFQKDKKQDAFVNIFDEREATMQSLEEFSKKNNTQVIVKLHPTSYKNYIKGFDRSDVSGLTLKYLMKPTKFFKVTGDIRMSSQIARDILCVSDIIVGYTSTMLIEAALLSKHILHVNIGKCQDFIDRPRYDNIFETALSKNEIAEKLDKMICGESKNYNMADIERFAYKVDGNCCERIFSIINEELK